MGAGVLGQTSGSVWEVSTGAGLFALASILLLHRYTQRGGWWRLPAALVTIYLGVFSKELAIMAPVAFVGVDTFLEMRARGGAAGGLLADLVVADLRDRAGLAAALPRSTSGTRSWSR